MSEIYELWKLNIPQLYGLPDFALDDAGVDGQGNVYVTDSINSRVYKFSPNSIPMGSFEIDCPTSSGEDASLISIAVDTYSNFYVTDTTNGYILKYDESGKLSNKYWAPNVITIGCNVHGMIYAFSKHGAIERIDCFDYSGNLTDVLPVPSRGNAHTDPSLLNIDVDLYGNVYLSDGMPPYRIWRIRADGSGTDIFRRHIDHPEDAILITDIGVDIANGNIYALLARKQAGRQILDCFSPRGEYLGIMEVPHSEMLYSIMCPGGDAGIYFLDNSTGPGAGELMCTSTHQQHHG